MTTTSSDRLLETSVLVDAPPERVWDLVSDVTRMGEWSPECRRCRWIGKQKRPVVGARFVGVNRRGLVAWLTRNVVEAAGRGEVFAFRTIEAAAVWTYRFEAEAGGTRLSESRVVGEPPWYSALAVRLVMGGTESHDRTLEAGMRATLERIKAVAESSPGSAVEG
jgi:uncharacterized protein YndB with AHSA1/START domain